MGGNMIDATTWQRNKAVWLTFCWSWDETWLMRLPDRQLKQYHLLTVGHVMKHDWWNCLARSVTHSLFGMWWNIIDEIAWQRNTAVSLTPCWSWDETWLMRLPGKEIKLCHSQPVGHDMKHDWWNCLARSVTYSLFVMWWNIIDETAWQRNKAVWLTYCQSWNETWLMRLPGKEIQQCHSHTVGHEMKHDCWQRNKVVSLTFCWSWHEK